MVAIVIPAPFVAFLIFLLGRRRRGDRDGGSGCRGVARPGVIGDSERYIIVAGEVVVIGRHGAGSGSAIAKVPEIASDNAVRVG